MDILLFLALGIAIGIIFGMLPGLHPNMVILFIPLFAALGLATPMLLALIVSMAISNSVTSFLPSILLGAPEAGSELAVLPGHKMLLDGHGYQAVKLTVIGGLGAAIFCAAMFPAILLVVPLLFQGISAYIPFLLIAIAGIMILSEEGTRKFIALALFMAAGAIGMLSSRLPIDSTIALFPIFSGFFGISMMLISTRKDIEIPEQTMNETYVSKRAINRSVITGSVAGVFSGLLPGVGASEISALASTGRDEHAFLVRIGAITTANIVLSILGLWLINKSRSGAAVVIGQMASLGFEDTIMIVMMALIAAGVSSAAAVTLAKKGVSAVSGAGYRNISCAIVSFIVAMTVFFSGIYGLLLLATCTAVGMLTNFAGVKRGVLMGVLMVPTILFYTAF